MESTPPAPEAGGADRTRVTDLAPRGESWRERAGAGRPLTGILTWSDQQPAVAVAVEVSDVAGARHRALTNAGTSTMRPTQAKSSAATSPASTASPSSHHWPAVFSAFRTRADAVRQPLLYLRSSHDRVVPDHNLDRMRALRPDLEVVMIDGDRFALHKNAAAGASAIAAFVARCGAADAAASSVEYCDRHLRLGVMYLDRRLVVALLPSLATACGTCREAPAESITIAGRVVDVDDTPVQGAKVTTIDETDGQITVLPAARSPSEKRRQPCRPASAPRPTPMRQAASPSVNAFLLATTKCGSRRPTPSTASRSCSPQPQWRVPLHVPADQAAVFVNTGPHAAPATR